MNKRLGEFQLLEILGESQLSTVYLAVDGQGRKIALKLMRETPFLNRKHILKVIETTDSLRNMLDHPHIVDVYQVGEVDDYYYVSMQLVTGPGTLEDEIKVGVGGTKPALKVGIEIADALVHAHSGNIVHGDLKPSNILLNENKEPMLTDFGVVSLNFSRSPGLGQRSVGTPKYMSPQQARGCFVSSLSDIYSFGVVLYEMLTGRLPYESEPNASIQQMVRVIQDNPVVPPEVANPLLTPAVCDVVQKMIEKEEENRPRTMVEVRTLLEDALQNIDSEPPPPSPPGFWKRLTNVFTSNS